MIPHIIPDDRTEYVSIGTAFDFKPHDLPANTPGKGFPFFILQSNRNDLSPAVTKMLGIGIKFHDLNIITQIACIDKILP